MKRSPAPARKKPLKRTAIKNRGSSPRRRAQLSTRAMKQNPRSASKDEIREAVFYRDGYRCRMGGVPGAGPCAGHLTPHHRRKGGQGGGYTVENLATLCVRHNDELEADADLAFLGRTMGLVLKRGDVWTVTHDRFWSLVDRDGAVPDARPDLGPCWMWRGRTTDNGKYGRYTVKEGHAVYAHRFAIGCVEAIVDGYEVDHLCFVTLCVNPRHLEQVPGIVNRQRANSRRPAPVACRPKGHPYTEENTIIRSDGKRECRTCKVDRQAAYHSRKKQR